MHKELRGLFIYMNKQIIYQNLQWTVTVTGSLVCTDHHFEIEREILQEIDWYEALKEKVWFNKTYFKQAYEFSIKNTSL